MSIMELKSPMFPLEITATVQKNTKTDIFPCFDVQPISYVMFFFNMDKTIETKSTINKSCLNIFGIMVNLEGN